MEQEGSIKSIYNFINQSINHPKVCDINAEMLKVGRERAKDVFAEAK